MRFFALSHFQDIILYIFPALIGAILFGLALSFSRFRFGGSKEEESETTYPEKIREKQGAFPVVLMLIIIGTILWAFFYILFTGLREVTI